ncbi:GNAT family N-acetyltransferase [Paenibacillus harenae]|uniref:GNAT family N-acetyltransferase n=1 Tax=Paenibacillus harenae TaxID=306543 RepID=UPI00041DD386|nr:GNAT family N-acetyltransferase [Paenibacillus harenae]
MIQVYDLKDKAEQFEKTVQLFWSQWGTDKNYKFYYDCMLHSMKTESDLPRFYIAVQNDSIIGTYALLRNDLISRQDILPWLACLYIVPEYRGRNMGAELLQHALHETRKMGYNSLYLCTDLEGYYEKYGWVHFTNGYIFNGTETKIYAAAIATNTYSHENTVIQSIKECPERRNAFIAYISAAWPAVKNAVIPQLEESLATSNRLPLTFLVLKNDRIIGFYQLIEQEYLDRKDLSPWIAPLFIDKSERGQALGAMLLQHGRKTAGQLGYEKVYLTTDHIRYYEKYGFREIGLSNFEWGRPSKIYEHDAISK